MGFPIGHSSEVGGCADRVPYESGVRATVLAEAVTVRERRSRDPRVLVGGPSVFRMQPLDREEHIAGGPGLAAKPEEQAVGCRPGAGPPFRFALVWA